MKLVHRVEELAPAISEQLEFHLSEDLTYVPTHFLKAACAALEGKNISLSNRDKSILKMEVVAELQSRNAQDDCRQCGNKCPRLI